MSELSKIERGRAERAYKFVEEALQRGIRDDYKSLVRKLPQMVMSGGLGQTIAFLYSKKDRSSHSLLYSQITKYFESDIVSVRLDGNNRELVKWVISLDSYRYSVATRELLSLVKWLKRFAEGMIV